MLWGTVAGNVKSTLSLQWIICRKWARTCSKAGIWKHSSKAQTAGGATTFMNVQDVTQLHKMLWAIFGKRWSVKIFRFRFCKIGWHWRMDPGAYENRRWYDGTTRQKRAKEDIHSFIQPFVPRRFILNLQRRFMILTLFQGHRWCFHHPFTGFIQLLQLNTCSL